MLDEAAALLGETGPFREALPQFSVRSQQQDMAGAISHALDVGRDLIVEAGTGTGKTFAYLVPVFLSGKKAIISTGTKNLQDQLFHRDIPLVRKALNVPVSVSLLKGRSNYLCIERMEKQLQHLDNVEPRMIRSLQSIKEWSATTRTGDIAEHNRLAENDRIWPHVTSTSDNCLGTDCDYFQSCHVMQARRQAQAADVVVVNHHLLLSDMALTEGGFGELLPSADIYVIDEAHQLADVASGFFGIGISSQQFIELAHDAQSHYLDQINETADFFTRCDTLIKAARDLRLVFGTSLRRAAWREIADDRTVQSAFDVLKQALRSLGEMLESVSDRSSELENCHTRYTQLNDRLQLLTQTSVPDHIHWFEVHHRSVTCHLTPLEIANAFQEKKSLKGGQWIFTSATLSVADRFDFFSQSLGLMEFNSLQLDSPFDYQNQTLLFLPASFPQPNTDEYLDAVVDTAKQVLLRSEGRAFLLFTSFRALNYTHERLKTMIDYPMFVQGQASRDRLLEQFRQTEQAVLLGTNSFWEGVDVRGDALVCVLIDKLPFAAPNDPVLQARLDAMREKGLNAFMHYQLPMAVIMLKQGVGRLIRDEQDYGVLVLCDPRLRGKSYGRTFLKSLPPMRQTSDWDDVSRLFEEKASPARAKVLV